MSVRKSSAIFGAVVVALLIVCIGLLIALLKNQPEKHLETSKQTTVTPTPSPYTSTPSPEELEYRLPSNVVPKHYDVRLQPDLDKATFTGTAAIEVEATDPVDNFVVHVQYLRLTVTNSSVQDSDGQALTSTPKEDREKQFYIMKLNSRAKRGTYLLKYEFHGNMSGSNVGFYRSSYNKDGKPRYLATSKFQPTYARQAFPCFDEPNFKAKFTVTLVHHPDYIALSNMPVKSVQTIGSDLKETHFEESVPMVTYLACFIVCDFKSLEGETKNGTKFRVFSTPHQVHKTKFALENGIQMLDFYEDYFGIKFPLPKSDMIAIPDFQSGAMEHWGLITYRETNLLYDEKESSAHNKQRVATVIGHELAHMWFGNLVTMDWWDDLWLNEGFASYIEYKGVNNVFKEWNMLDQILTEDLQPVMRLDATTSSHPIIQEVKNPDQITEIFDAISYNKGASILRMLEAFVGQENFRKGISNFLTKYKYGNAKTEDLWYEIGEVYNKPEVNISVVMSTWTKQMGFPVVSIKRTGNTTFQVNQKRFLTNQKREYSIDDNRYGYIWDIPLFYVTSQNKTGMVWINNNETTIDIPHINENDWVKFNHNQTGYYLVNYQPSQWTEFSKLLTINNQVLSPADRSSLLFDSFMLAQAEIIGYSIPLNLAKNMINEKDLTPWETAYTCLVQLGHLFPESHFKNFIRELTQTLYNKLGWKAHNGHVDNLLQTTIVGLACYSGNLECKQEAAKKMKLMMENKDPGVPLALRNTLFHYAMEMGGSEAEWQYLWDKYEAETSAQERIKLLYGMAHVKDPKLINRLLQYAKDPSKIRSQDFYTVLTYVAGNPDGRDIVWDFVRNNWNYLANRFTTNDRDLGRAVKNICDYFNTEEKLQEMEEFFAAYPEAGAGARARQQALENVRNNIHWMKTHETAVDNWLNENGHVPFSRYRLSGDVIPVHYNLRLKPYIPEGLFEGDVNITVKIENRTKFLIVQAHDLSIDETVVETEDGKPVPVRIAFGVPQNQLWVIELEKPVSKNQILIMKFGFKGELSGSKLVGFYRSSYKKDNDIRYLATSQFQSTYARQAFPCFDEPQFKATFTVHVVHHKNYPTVLSNMPVEETNKIDSDWFETKFEKSVKMVTYLLAVIVSDFEYEMDTTSDGVKVKVYARPDERKHTKYAVDVGVKTLQFFENYFKVKYPLPKLDLIAIPDFQAGAMENWGLVTFRETLLLYDEAQTSAYTQLRIDAVIGHEIAHMWFGNLVTMKWWDDLWLNEGFASYMEYKSMEHIKPEWEVDAQFFFEDTHRVLIPDASLTSHPIVQSVGHPDEISAIFDAISYSKGASVLRMLEFFLGTDTFKLGVTAYLKKFSFDNAVTDDLWMFLRQAAQSAGKDIDVAKVMKTWTLQMGYPYINITKFSEDENSITYLARPHRFLIDPHAQLDSSNLYSWDIPLSYRTAKNPEPVIQWIHANDSVSMVKTPSKMWTKFNSDSKGYYLVNYGDEWPSIISQLLLNHKQMTASDRANLISDVFLLARGGLTPYVNALRLTTYLRDERHFVPWETAKRSLSYLLNVLKHDDEINNMLKEYLRELTRTALNVVGWEDTKKHLTDRLRVTLVDLSCDSGSDTCLEETKRILKEWKDSDGKKVIPSNIRVQVFKYGIQKSDDTMWDYMLSKYLSESSSQMQKDLLHGMAFSQNKETILGFLKRAEDNSTIRDQDYFSVLSYIASNPVGLPLVWDYLRSNWKALVDRFSINDRYLGNAVQSICSHFTTEERLNEIKIFFAENPDAGAGERSRKEAIQTVENAISWLKSYKEPVKMWLEDQKISKPWHNVRLPHDVIPLHYDVKLHPHIEEGSFEGSVSIHVTKTVKNQYLLVHAHQLNVTRARVTHDHGLHGDEVKLAAHFPNNTNQYWILEGKSAFEPGNYTIHMEFEGTLLGKLVGFYRSSYVDGNTKKLKYLATSQFQSTFARQAFPCLDEPRFKTTYNITLVHWKNMTALSNMPVLAQTDLVDGLRETRFEESVKMVTYLVAVIVCDFDYKTNHTNTGVEIRVYAPSDRIEQAYYGVETGQKVLEYFEDYFGIKYPLPKLDMIALPDFRAGAMENWGLITYREVYMLYDKYETSPGVQFSIAMIIAHEIAHMWFGNYVTMEWWDDLWLNEGFATFMAYKCIDTVRPEMDGIGMFLLGELSKVLEPDATLSSHPIVTPVNHPDEISAIFDAISYSKGASVLRKLEDFLTPQNFRKGISKYLTKYKHGNAKTNDLWEELTSFAPKGENVTEVMDTWTRQMGYPVVTIQLDGTRVNATQSRFLLNPDSSQNDSLSSPYNYIWQIPIRYKNQNKEDLTWLKSNTEILTDIPDGLVKLNVDHAGYYLVNYNDSHWEEWANVLLKEDKDKPVWLTHYDRSNLMSDAFLLASAGHLSYSLALELTTCLKEKENEFLPWSTGKSALLGVYSLLKGNDEVLGKMKEYLQYTSMPKFNNLTWEDTPDEPYLNRRLRVTVADLACRTELTTCLNEAKDKLTDFLDNQQSIPSAVRSLVYRYGLGNDKLLWQKLWDTYKKTQTAQEKRDMLIGLAYIKDKEMLKSYLKEAKKPDLVRTQDFFTVLNNVAANPDGLDIAWEFYETEWDFLVERYTLNDGSLGGSFRSITSHFTTEEDLNKMEEFIKAHPDAGAGKTDRKEALEIVTSNIQWSKKYTKEIKNWLDKTVGP